MFLLGLTIELLVDDGSNGVGIAKQIEKVSFAEVFFLVLALCSHVVDVDCFLHFMNTFIEHVTVIQIFELLLTNLVSDGLCLGLFLLIDSS